MSGESMRNKSSKLEAARKKLKEYQNRGGVEQDLLGNMTEEAVDMSLKTKSKNNICNEENNSTENSICTALSEERENMTNDVRNRTDIDNGLSSDFTSKEMWITRKSQLTNHLNKLKLQNREEQLELKEGKLQLKYTTEKLVRLQQKYLEQQQCKEQLHSNNSQLQNELAQERADCQAQKTQLEELQLHISEAKKYVEAQAEELKETRCKLDMAEIRLKQLSDEFSMSKNSDVAMSQNQLMQEQQIRDLQAMLQQLTEENEQANVQYQNYVQQLNMEIMKLNKSNIEIRQENEVLQNREQQLITHIGGLERDIQKKNLQLQEKPFGCTTEQKNENAELRWIISDLKSERHEFLLKIKSQEERLQFLKSQLQKSQTEVEGLGESLRVCSSEQPEHTKLLAIMESDKVAASRALVQNIEMKKQQDELELRFVQLTNEKADLRNMLDAQEYENREIRTKIEVLKMRVNTKDELFKLKDEEMIRLAHENTELSNQVQVLQAMLQEQSVKKSSGIKFDGAAHGCPTRKSIDIEHFVYAKELNSNPTIPELANGTTMNFKMDSKFFTSEAMDKLQEKFTRLTIQVADLTDEKQRLEHLVVQLQDETETIGEYITLYQTQRRMLKQREYEKAAQMQLLHDEREQLCEKIQLLNNLVRRLNLPNTSVGDTLKKQEQPVKKLDLENNVIPQPELMDSQLIINQIQHMITEIELNTKNHVVEVNETHKVDQLNCCLGEFEIV